VEDVAGRAGPGD